MLSINIDEVLNKPNIIDIRNEQSYNNNHIPNARNIPFEKLLSTPSTYLNKSDTYYIYCQKGLSSVRVSQILNKLGYKVININGGYEAWILRK